MGQNLTFRSLSYKASTSSNVIFTHSFSNSLRRSFISYRQYFIFAPHDDTSRKMTTNIAQGQMHNVAYVITVPKVIDLIHMNRNLFVILQSMPEWPLSRDHGSTPSMTKPAIAQPTSFYCRDFAFFCIS